jgi:hypothetical protein
VLLDTNTYLRLAKRIKPLLGTPFGQKDYVLTILKEVETEVLRSSRLRFHYPWFDDADLAAERVSRRVRLSRRERAQIEAAKSVRLSHVLENAGSYTAKGRSPPSGTDCFCLAFGQVRPAIVATDDLGMHKLANDFEIKIWHGYEPLKKMLTAKLVNRALVDEIYRALEQNDDLTATWRRAKHMEFRKVFGPRP